MNIRIYTIRDAKAECYLPPFTFRTDGEAVRAFDDSVQKPGTALHDHPEDFFLYRVGCFNQESGKVEPLSPVSLGCGSYFVKSGKEDQNG